MQQIVGPVEQIFASKSNCFEIDKSKFELTQTQVCLPKLNFERVQPEMDDRIQDCLPTTNSPEPSKNPELWTHE